MSAGPGLWTVLAVLLFGMLSWYDDERRREPGGPLFDARFWRTVGTCAVFTAAAVLLETEVSAS